MPLNLICYATVRARQRRVWWKRKAKETHPPPVLSHAGVKPFKSSNTKNTTMEKNNHHVEPPRKWNIRSELYSHSDRVFRFPQYKHWQLLLSNDTSVIVVSLDFMSIIRSLYEFCQCVKELQQENVHAYDHCGFTVTRWTRKWKQHPVSTDI